MHLVSIASISLSFQCDSSKCYMKLRYLLGNFSWYQLVLRWNLTVVTSNLNFSGLNKNCILCVPDLKYNLMTANKLTKDLNSQSLFTTLGTYFKIWLLGWWIGSTKEHIGLFYFPLKTWSSSKLLDFNLKPIDIKWGCIINI